MLPRNLVLKPENVVQTAIVALRPQMTAGSAVDQLER